MFMKAFMPATKGVPCFATTNQVGSPKAGYLVPAGPPGCSSIPAKIVANMTEMNVKNAEKVAIVASAEKVRGSEQIHDTMATMALNAMVQRPPLDMVLRYLAPVRQWKPMMNVLFSRNMTAVKYHAQRLPQKSIWPMSQTSLTSGWRIQNSLQFVNIDV